MEPGIGGIGRGALPGTIDQSNQERNFVGLRNDLAALITLAKVVVERRKARREWLAYASTREAPAPGSLYSLLYFGDEPHNLYQARQWYGPLESLSAERGSAILARDVRSANVIRSETSLPVLWLRNAADVEELLSTHPLGAIFYVNQNILNFRMMRARIPAHVFLSHGESEKDYMASNQLKAYDYTFVAGEAARDRLRARLIAYDVDARTLAIGRPQIDFHRPGPSQSNDERTVVFYAPTWEGDRPSMSYSSVVTHGYHILEALVSSGEYRVIYRAHPLTGRSDPSYRSAHKAIVNLLEQANRASQTAAHIVDDSPTLDWQFDAADVCIADISAMAFDWLATGKPIVLTEPTSAEAAVDPAGIAGVLVCVGAGAASAIISLLEEADSPARLARRSALVNYYFGDTTPGASSARWLDAAKRVVDERSALS